jgi:enoyl-[acyl-carrier protein] reductase/trans-2-enoyl-CoA reductase (NAD+)
MIVKPRVRGFVCTTAHPIGCERNVRKQIDYAISRASSGGPRRVLIIGSSTGYGLSARIMAAFAYQAATLGVFLEKDSTNGRPASAGWYNSAAVHSYANDQGLYAKSVNGDAFSQAVKQLTVETIKADLGQVDLVIYSIASPRKTDPVTHEIYNSTLKPIGKEVSMRGINTDKGMVQEFTLSAASEKEISDTVAVMGGEDWIRWIDILSEANVLATGAKTTAFTYIGEQITWDLYWHGTIGRAKQDLDESVLKIRDKLASINGDARIAVLKAVVTQASAAIPIMPLYLSLLFKEMKSEGSHEGCIEQIDRLFEECLYNSMPRIDAEGRFRVDNLELQAHIQEALTKKWKIIDDNNLDELADFKGYKTEFMNLFGFNVDGVDYEEDVEVDVKISGLLC